MDRRELDEFLVRARELRQQEELDRTAVAALTEFEAAGIEALLLKGPVLARRLYTEGERRGYWDIDLLVSPRDLETARDVLSGLGFVRGQEVFGIDDVGGVQHGEVWARQGENRGGPICIDLHWRLSRCDAPGEAVWEALAEGRGSLRLCGREVAVPGDAGLALHLSIHAAQGGVEDTKALADLRRGIERWPLEVWVSATRLARRVRGDAVFAAGLRLLPAGAELARQLELPPTPQLDWEIRHRQIRPRGTFHLQAWRDAQGLRERLNVLRRSLLPTPQWIRWQFPWAERHRWLLPVAYACHITRAPLWAARAMRFRRSAGRTDG
jgi:Uncharacterised nucleotidyltransferase